MHLLPQPPRPPNILVNLQEILDILARTPRHRKQPAEDIRILDSHACAGPVVWEGRVRCVAEESDPALAPGCGGEGFVQCPLDLVFFGD
jgi:hypothetical protein